MSSPPTAQPRLLVAAGIIWLDGELLVQRRCASAKHGAGRLEFPGGKIERGESPQTALARELIEEWGPAAARLRIGAVAEVLHHVYAAPGPEVVLVLFHVDAAAWRGEDWRAQLCLIDGAEVHRQSLGALDPQDFLAADCALIGRLKRGELRPAFP